MSDQNPFVHQHPFNPFNIPDPSQFANIAANQKAPSTMQLFNEFLNGQNQTQNAGINISYQQLQDQIQGKQPSSAGTAQAKKSSIKKVKPSGLKRNRKTKAKKEEIKIDNEAKYAQVNHTEEIDEDGFVRPTPPQDWSEDEMLKLLDARHRRAAVFHSNHNNSMRLQSFWKEIAREVGNRDVSQCQSKWKRLKARWQQLLIELEATGLGPEDIERIKDSAPVSFEIMEEVFQHDASLAATAMKDIGKSVNVMSEDQLQAVPPTRSQRAKGKETAFLADGIANLGSSYENSTKLRIEHEKNMKEAQHEHEMRMRKADLIEKWVNAGKSCDEINVLLSLASLG